MISPEKKHLIYRSQALEQYIQSQQKAVLLHLLASRAILFMWILLVLFIVVWGMIWENSIPVYTMGTGVLQEENLSNSLNQQRMIAIVFVPVHPSLVLHSGLSTQLQIRMGTQEVMFIGQIERILPGVASPQNLRKSYALSGIEALLITQPSIIVIVHVTSPTPIVSTYAGSTIKAQIQTGEQPLLSLLSGMTDQ